MEAERIRLKSKSPPFKCCIFAGRHMPAADLLIGHVFFPRGLFYIPGD